MYGNGLGEWVAVADVVVVVVEGWMMMEVGTDRVVSELVEMGAEEEGIVEVGVGVWEDGRVVVVTVIIVEGWTVEVSEPEPEVEVSETEVGWEEYVLLPMVPVPVPVGVVVMPVPMVPEEVEAVPVGIESDGKVTEVGVSVLVPVVAEVPVDDPVEVPVPVVPVEVPVPVGRIEVIGVVAVPLPGPVTVAGSPEGE